tara:strand:+ start:725 stop:946 length:222 start_codon:yes stop_codon:yes gene_type:complete
MGRLHIHSLVGGEGMGNKSEAWKDWFHDPFGGRAQILEYDKSMGASFYLSKYVSKSLGEWAIGGDWPTEEVSK